MDAQRAPYRSRLAINTEIQTETRPTPATLGGTPHFAPPWCMVRVAFTANLQRHLDAPVQSASVDCVRAVLDNVFAAPPRLRSSILDDQGRVRRHVSIYINADQIADRDHLTDPVNDADEIFVVQALSGG